MPNTKNDIKLYRDIRIALIALIILVLSVVNIWCALTTPYMIHWLIAIFLPASSFALMICINSYDKETKQVCYALLCIFLFVSGIVVSANGVNININFDDAIQLYNAVMSVIYAIFLFLFAIFSHNGYTSNS